MSYTVNLGCWGSIFAVPTAVVDNYLKIAGSAQLKVLLWILRHSGENFDEETISAQLNMGVFDVKDCIEFWSSFNIIAVNNGVITPAQQTSAQSVTIPQPIANAQPVVNTQPIANVQPVVNPQPIANAQPVVNPQPIVNAQPVANPQPYSSASESAEIPKNSAESLSTETESSAKTTSSAKSSNTEKSDTLVSRPIRPDPTYIAKRISEDKEIADLLNEAQYIFGRPISPNENASIIMLHDNEGLPADVILMLLAYGLLEKKKGMRYIEAMGVAWAKEGISTPDQVDRKIREIEDSQKAWRKVQSLLGLDTRNPSDKEEEVYSRWINDWKFSDDVIKYAYNICVDSKGKYIKNYVNKILESWYNSGIRTLEQARAEREKPSQNKFSGNSDSNNGRASSFDVNDLSDLSMFND